MNIRDKFNKAIKKVTNKVYYHGSVADIHGGYLQPKEQFNHKQDGVVTAAFVTSDERYAKFFPINRCIGNGQCHLRNKKIYLEQLRDDIKSEFYVYTVYETPDNPFVHDHGTEYYARKPIKIAKRTKYNTAEEIEKLGYEIYVLDEPLKSKKDRKSGNNFAVQQEMDEAIKQNKFHRVDIASMLKKRPQNSVGTIFHKLFRGKGE